MLRTTVTISLIFLSACGGAVTQESSSSSDAGTPGTSPPPVATQPAPSPPPPATAVPPTGRPVSPPSACPSCVATVAWRADGGLGAYQEQSLLSSCSTYSRTRTTSTATQQCTAQLGICSSPRKSVAMILAALATPDVQAALAGTTMLYGSDPRGCDGSVLSITASNKTVDVGGDCSQAGRCGGPTTCTPVPPGLRALADALVELDREELTNGECVFK